MIQSAHFVEALAEYGIEFFTGVPDSLLKDFCAYLTDHVDETRHVITANEGNAVAVSAGHYLGTGRPGLVYLQNSGLGNIVNPLLSLNDPEVYGLPVLLMIGWRGEPGVKDEPQHVKQGRTTPDLLNAMEIPWQILDAEKKDPAAVVAWASQQMNERQGPVALLVRKEAFEPYSLKKKAKTEYPLVREQAIHKLIDQLGSDDLVVVTTGMAARELYEYRQKLGKNTERDFMTVGGMGHAASIAFGLARSQPNRRVVCLDGDGALLMHMGAMAILGQSGQKNLLHIVLNNGAHDSVGGQPTCALSIDIATIAKGCGYRNARVAESSEDIDKSFKYLLSKDGPSLFEIRINKGSRKDLGRPRSTPAENRDALMLRLGSKV